MSPTKITEFVEQVSKMSLLEVAELVKALETKFGVSAAAPVAAATATSTAPEKAADSEKTEFKLTLQDSGADKIKVIKALRAVTSLTLKDAKDMVENVPAVIAESASKDDAKKIKEALEAAGAKVELS